MADAFLDMSLEDLINSKKKEGGRRGGRTEKKGDKGAAPRGEKPRGGEARPRGVNVGAGRRGGSGCVLPLCVAVRTNNLHSSTLDENCHSNIENCHSNIRNHLISFFKILSFYFPLSGSAASSL